VLPSALTQSLKVLAVLFHAPLVSTSCLNNVDDPVAIVQFDEELICSSNNHFLGVLQTPLRYFRRLPNTQKLLRGMEADEPISGNFFINMNAEFTEANSIHPHLSQKQGSHPKKLLKDEPL
jgi:hypothetical protein